MIVIGKSSVSREQLQHRRDVGVTDLELHLNPEDIRDWGKRDEITHLTQELNLNIRTVHAPMGLDFKLESLNTLTGFNRLRDVCELADKLSHFHGNTVGVVLHLELNRPQLDRWGIYGHIVDRLEALLELHPNITINLENETVIQPGSQGQCISVKGSSGLEVVEVCKSLREDLGTDRIGLVLDIGHALATMRLIQGIFSQKYHSFKTLEDYIEGFSPYLNIIHLANARGFGYKEDHGTTFETLTELELLREIVHQLKRIDYQGVVTIEVQEEDYLGIKNFFKVRDPFTKYLAEYDKGGSFA